MNAEMFLNKGVILFLVILLGVVVPFIPEFTVIEIFFLLIPFAIVFIATTVYLLVTLFTKHLRTQKALFFFSILPVFILSQLASGFTVDKIQKLRSESIIKEIDKVRKETRELPEQYSTAMGIKYQRLREKNNFMLSYSRGFMVTEKYDSETKEWKSYGWND